MRTWVLVSFLCAATLLYAQDEPQYASFSGKVKSVTERSYKAKKRHGEIVKGKPSREYNWEHDFTIGFDTNGVKTSKLLYRYKGKYGRLIFYDYDDKGFLIEERITGKDLLPEGGTRFSNEYNATGSIVKRIVTSSEDQISSTFLYSYDASGNIHETFLVGQGNPQRTRDSRQFDSTWKVTEQWFYTDRGALISRHDFSYDYRGVKTQEMVYSPTDQIIMQYRWVYGENDELITYEICGSSPFNCEAWTYKYLYDKSGNWIRSIDYRNGKPVYFKEREITYY